MHAANALSPRIGLLGRFTVRIAGTSCDRFETWTIESTERSAAMFTFYDLLVSAGLLFGATFGAVSGAALFGAVGGVIGGIIGAVVGVLAGRIPLVQGLRSVQRDLSAKSVEELRSYLRSPDCFTPNCVLLELDRRGEDIQCELPSVVDLLNSEDAAKRRLGWAALTSAFPELVESAHDYRIGDSFDECRRKTEMLRRIPASPMTREECDVHEPYRSYVFMMLMFDCHDCKQCLNIVPPFEHLPHGWGWYHDAADQAWRAGWYVPSASEDGSTELYCLCPECAAKKGFTAPATRK